MKNFKMGKTNIGKFSTFFILPNFIYLFIFFPQLLFSHNKWMKSKSKPQYSFLTPNAFTDYLEYPQRFSTPKLSKQSERTHPSK